MALPKQSSRVHPTTEEEIRKLYPVFQKLLLSEKDDIIGRVSNERAQLDDQIMQAPGDDADVSVIDVSADYFLRLANNHQKELLEIRDAIDRMNRGVYGVCENCENPIAIERLKRLPTARLCIDCQSTLESKNRNIRLEKYPNL